MGAVGTLHVVSAHLFASFALAYSVRFRCIWIFVLFRSRSRGVNAAEREVRGRASAVSRFANVSLLVRADGCHTISDSRSGAGT
jgi:hypothetical protein